MANIHSMRRLMVSPNMDMGNKAASGEVSVEVSAEAVSVEADVWAVALEVVEWPFL